MAELAFVLMCTAICGLFCLNLKLHRRLKNKN